jgi:CO/xanthine dehydrogenase FAD-binding subunit
MAPRYAKPASLDEALLLLKEDRWTILAGGTDFYPALGAAPLRGSVLDINGLAELRGLSETDSHIVIGARTTWTDVLQHPLPAAFDGLKLAAREVGSIQIQNRGTVAGNLCNASPAADGVPPLLTLEAEVDLHSAEGSRILPVSDFILGNRRTALQPGEMVTAIRIPTPEEEAVRDVCRARADAVEDLRRARQRLGMFLLRHGRVFTGHWH